MSEWGKGDGMEAARGFMLWVEKEMDMKQFIAGTEKDKVGRLEEIVI